MHALSLGPAERHRYQLFMLRNFRVVEREKWPATDTAGIWFESHRSTEAILKLAGGPNNLSRVRGELLSRHRKIPASFFVSIFSACLDFFSYFFLLWIP